MVSRWNAKGDTVSTIVLWFGSILAVVICVLWLTKTLASDHITVQQIDNELTSLRSELNKACRMYDYWKEYNPKMNEGNLFLNNMQICIDSSPCKVVFFSAENFTVEYMDTNIIINNTTPCGNVKNCNLLYYDSENYATVHPTFVEILDANTCENERPVITRCRLLLCELGQTRYLRFDDIVIVNISKDRNEVFNFDEQ